MKKDKLFAGSSSEDPFQKIRAFAFDEDVVPVFQDMISRSVPGYETMLRAIGVFAMQYAQENTRLYDLGTSLGAVAYVLAKSTEAKHCEVIAVDNSEPMILACRKRLKEQNILDRITLIHDDIENIEIKKASVIVSNFTLQFIQRSKRDYLIQNIYNGLEDDGVFVLSEKIRAPEDAVDAFLIDHYHGYKKTNGYSNEEVARKRNALENVLVPDTITEWKARLRSAGFTETHVWFQCFNFISMIAIKTGV